MAEVEAKREEKAVAVFREYLRIKTIQPNPDYGKFIWLCILNLILRGFFWRGGGGGDFSSDMQRFSGVYYCEFHPMPLITRPKFQIAHKNRIETTAVNYIHVHRESSTPTLFPCGRGVPG